MAERRVFIRVSTRDADRAVRELRRVGVRGERSLKRITKASRPASAGLVALDRSAGLVNRQLAMMAGRVAAVAAPAALGAFVKRAVQSADLIGKTADKIGIGVEKLQAYRFAASQSGVSQEKLDAALERFTKRLGEAALGTGEAAKAYEALGIRVADGTGRVREADQVLREVADALARVPDPATRSALAFKLFSDQGLALTNLLRHGSAGLERFTRRARELGLVIDAQTVRQAEALNDVFDQLGRTLSVNFQAGLLEGFVDSLGELKDIVGDPALRQGARELGEFIGTMTRLMVEHRAEVAAFVAALAALKVSGAATKGLPLPKQLQVLIPLLGAGAAGLATYDAVQRKAAEGSDFLSGSLEELRAKLARSREMLEQFRTLSGPQLVERFAARLPSFDLTRAEDRAKGIRILEDSIADLEQAIAELERAGRKPPPLIVPEFGASADRDRAAQANAKVVASLKAEGAALEKTARQRAIDTALRRLSAEASEAQRAAVARLAGELYDEARAREEADTLREEGKALTESLASPLERYNRELARAKELLAAGAITQETFNRRKEQLAEALRDDTSELERFEAAAARAAETLASGFIDAVTGAESLSDVLASLERQLLGIANAAIEESLADVLKGGLGLGGGSTVAGASAGSVGAARDSRAPSGGALGFFEDLAAGFGSFLTGLFHEGGRAGAPAAMRRVPAAAFLGAPRLHDGTLPGLRPGEIPAVLDKREIVLNPAQSAAVRQAPPGRRQIILQGPLVSFGGGEPAGDPGFTRDQVVAAVLEAVGELERER